MANWYDNVPAPMDADGREVPLDTRELVLMGKRREVYSYEYAPATKRWFVLFVDSRITGEVRDCTLPDSTLPDSWDKLEEDAAKGACGYFGMDSAPDCKGCPARGSRLSDGCNATVARDIVRRAKALTEVVSND